jgi:hypothetical protein
LTALTIRPCAGCFWTASPKISAIGGISRASMTLTSKAVRCRWKKGVNAYAAADPSDSASTSLSVRSEPRPAASPS